MLDALKKLGGGSSAMPAREQAEELQALIGTAREERGALSTMLTQIELQGSKLSQVGKSLQQVHEQAAGTTTRLDELTTRLGAIDGKAQGFEQIDTRIQALLDAVGQAEQTAEKLIAPDGELKQHRHAVQQLSSQALQTHANLDALKKEQSTLDQLREQLRKAQAEVHGAEDHTAKLKGDFDRLRSLAAQLSQEHGKLKEGLRETREDANTTTEAVKDVEKKLVPLATLNELSKSTEERLAALNALAEHVSQKIRVLDNQKHTVEHAVVESNRFNEMVWNMDVQIAKLNEGARQAAQTDEIVQRIEQVAQESGAQLESALKSRADFAQDVAKLAGVLQVADRDLPAARQDRGRSDGLRRLLLACRRIQTHDA